MPWVHSKSDNLAWFQLLQVSYRLHSRSCCHHHSWSHPMSQPFHQLESRQKHLCSRQYAARSLGCTERWTLICGVFHVTQYSTSFTSYVQCIHVYTRQHNNITRVYRILYIYINIKIYTYIHKCAVIQPFNDCCFHEWMNCFCHPCFFSIASYQNSLQNQNNLQDKSRQNCNNPIQAKDSEVGLG